MKGISNFMLAATLSLVCGCNLISDLFIVEPRGGGRPEDKLPRDTAAPERPSVPVFDTAVFFTAVRFPEEYDWCLDTACGNASSEILLYRNGNIVRTIAAGRGTNISSDPDFIHTVGGRVFTEYPGISENVLSVDGKEFLRIPSNERLKGVLNRDGHFYTLTQGCLGRGIVLRRDNTELLRDDSGILFGDFNDPSYPESGALYEIGAHYCFCYKDAAASCCHLVKDGIPTLSEMSGSDAILDMKLSGKNPDFARTKGFGRHWLSARLFYTSDGTCIAGQCSDSEGGPIHSCVASLNDGSTDEICSGEAILYCGAGISWGVISDYGGKIKIITSRGGQTTMPDTYHFFSGRCAAPTGDKLMIALTPRDRSIPPKVLLGDKVYEPEGLGNGFIAGVSCRITQTN